MSILQTLLSLVLLIFVLSVMVQAVQEVVKAALKTKTTVMADTIQKFMGDHLTLDQITRALSDRGLDMHALESLDTKAFRELLEGVDFQSTQLQGIVKATSATEDRIKDNIASAYDGARDAFQNKSVRASSSLPRACSGDM